LFIMPASFATDDVTPSPLTALVVEPSVTDAVSISLMLSELGFQVIVSETFHDASSRLSVRPALLVTELRLGEYNGLHLVLRGKSAHPSLAAIVTSNIADTALYKEAEQLDATYVVKTVGAQEFRAAILRSVFRAEGDTTPIRPPYERRKSDRRLNVQTTHEPEFRVAERRAPTPGRLVERNAPPSNGL
jgi:DNA-binding response OmpR family regulator